MLIALWAALAMVVQDILGVLMVQSENRKRGTLAGVFDAAGWLFALVTLKYSLAAVDGHNTSLKVLVVLSVTVANIIGSRLGVMFGDKFFPDQENERLTIIEAEIAALKEANELR